MTNINIPAQVIYEINATNMHTHMMRNVAVFGFYYSPALKNWGLTGFDLSLIPYIRNAVRYFSVTVLSGSIVARILKHGNTHGQ